MLLRLCLETSAYDIMIVLMMNKYLDVNRCKRDDGLHLPAEIDLIPHPFGVKYMQQIGI